MKFKPTIISIYLLNKKITKITIAIIFNLHTHHPTRQPDLVEVENLYFGQESTGHHLYQSVGLHPWHLSDIALPEAKAWLMEQSTRPEVVAIGETGLDKVTDTPMEIQIAAFQLCIEVAQTRQMPLIIHCVRAYEEVLLQLKTAFEAGITVPVIFHGFNKGPEVAQMLLRAGCYLSFGAALLDERSHAGTSLQQTPADRFFLETDVAQVSIKTIYDRAAALRAVSRGVLEAQVWGNRECLFNLRDI